MGSVHETPLQPALPVKNPCLSYWQRTSRAFPHLHENSTVPVPAFAKYVVIGSGIAGALTAFELIQRVGAGEVLILEAREAASGASSRNAGHVRPGTKNHSFEYFINLDALDSHSWASLQKEMPDSCSILQSGKNIFRKCHESGMTI